MPRETPQRKAIHRALETANRPLSAKETLEVARESVPRLGIATVYRTLNLLLEEEQIVPVEIPGESTTRYEVAGKKHHHHFHCRACGSVYEVPGCPGDLAAITPDGFVLESHELTLFGLCANCS